MKTIRNIFSLSILSLVISNAPMFALTSSPMLYTSSTGDIDIANNPSTSVTVKPGSKVTLQWPQDGSWNLVQDFNNTVLEKTRTLQLESFPAQIKNEYFASNTGHAQAVFVHKPQPGQMRAAMVHTVTIKVGLR